VYVSRSNGLITVSFLARETETALYGDLQRYYTIETTAGLRTPAWSALEQHTDIHGLGQQVTYTNSLSDKHSCFYRVKVRLE
jgi:hypothetical protein